MKPRYQRFSRMVLALVPACGLVLALVAVWGLAGCGTGTGSSPAVPSGGATAVPGSSAAVASAAAPGDLSGDLLVYSSVAPATQEAIDAAFMKKYPKVKITLNRLSGASGEADIVFVNEAKHGGSPADIVFGATPRVVEDNPELYAVLSEIGVRGLDTWPANNKSDRYIEGIDGLWGIGYDTTKVSGADVPNSWQDILNPKFAGKCVVLEIRGKNPGLISWADNMQKTYGDQFLTRLASLNCQVADTGQLAGQIVAAGGAVIGFPFFPSMVAPSKSKGAPMEYKVLTDPLLTGGKYIEIPARAPHQKLAVEMLSWFLTPEAQSVACGDGIYGSPLSGVPGCGAVSSAKAIQPNWRITDDRTEHLAKLMGIAK